MLTVDLDNYRDNHQLLQIKNATIANNLSFDTRTWDSSNTSEITLFQRDKAPESPLEPCIPTSDKDNPDNICNWLVAPFDLTSGFGYKTSDNSSFFGPNFTLEVTYSTRALNGSDYVYTSHTSTVDLTYKDTDNNIKPLLTGFVSHGDYTLTLNIEKGGVVVLLDVAITPWISAETGADPRDVYNW